MPSLIRTGDNPLLELRGIRKVYASVVANDGIDLILAPGEIRAILGENGAGKSTLMKIIYGMAAPCEGEILWQGQSVQMGSPKQARALGIGMVFQHFQLFETLTVVQNVALALPGRPDLNDLSQRIHAVGQRYGLPVDAHRLVHTLSVGERQRVEIIRCLLQNPRLLIMDEPTSVLTPQAVRKLFETLRQLADEGCSILYISHKLDEVQQLCHSATILRGGKVAGHCIPSRETPASMARMMIGKELVPCRRSEAPAPAPGVQTPRLQVRALSRAASHPFGTALKDIGFDLQPGEILGIAGVSGNGQQELMLALSGEAPLAACHAPMIRLNGQAVAHLDSASRHALGLGFVPEERLGRGTVPAMTLADNSLLTAYDHGLLKLGLIRRDAVSQFARSCIEGFRVRCSGPQAPANSLSGGNLQKFIVGRELMQRPLVLIAAQPTWGVDVGAAAFIRQSLIGLRDSGAGLLVVSEELDELFEICDRIAVIADGRLSPAVPIEETDVETIGLWMSGMWPHEGTGAGEESVARARLAGHELQSEVRRVSQA
ncbi:ABC transporter ATP-binding protein [uncultured Comamonas sp.]|uniref:ABC transporter ATP-binding protein n=1 Tax=uncultured Comamonas sp. TaxID=114710 RepID=UPI0025DD2885|nr:ABC transporter ATP-binding protein [uncultured Comamonas sp.]